VVENKWRAQRYGVQGSFVDISGNGAITVAELLDQVLEDIASDAAALGCSAEVEHCRTIVGKGTSADAQIAVYEEAGKRSDGRADAFARRDRMGRRSDAAIGSLWCVAALVPGRHRKRPEVRARLLQFGAIGGRADDKSAESAVGPLNQADKLLFALEHTGARGVDLRA